MIKLLLAVVVFLFLQGGANICSAEPDPVKLGENKTETVDSGTNQPPQPEVFGDAGSTLALVSKVIFYLIVIIGIFIVIVKFLAQKNAGIASGKSLGSMGGVPLGTGKSIQIVKIGKSLYVVGVGDDVQLLEKIEDADEVALISDQLLRRSDTGGKGLNSITSWIRGLRESRKVEEEEMDNSFQELFLSKMSNISDRKKRVAEMLKDDQVNERMNDRND